jgi:hypothetical protein
MQHDSGDRVACYAAGIARQFDVAEAVKSELWFPNFFAVAFESVVICGTGCPQIVRVSREFRGKSYI